MSSPCPMIDDLWLKFILDNFSLFLYILGSKMEIKLSMHEQTLTLTKRWGTNGERFWQILSIDILIVWISLKIKIGSLIFPNILSLDIEEYKDMNEIKLMFEVWLYFADNSIKERVLR